MSGTTTVRAITHIHTRYSNGKSSEMDPVISGAIRRILGDLAPDEPWSECFTSIPSLVRLLQRPDPRSPVGLLVVTDHMNARSHRLPEELLRAAAAEPRLATGGELMCVERDVDGSIRRAPEVLVYGGPQPVPGPFGPHFGVSQAILDELYRTCRAPGSTELQTSRVLHFCAERQLACALAHPFDGHELSALGMLEIISQARFIETVNGGYPAESTEVLTSLIEFHNRAVQGFTLSARMAERWPQAAEWARRIQERRRGLLHAWGGSDAHHRNFDRVVMRFQSARPEPTAGDLFRVMLEQPVSELLQRGTFRIEGRPGSSMSVLDDVVRIVLRNLRRLTGVLVSHPRVAAMMLSETQRVVRQELGNRAQRQAELLHGMERLYPFAQLLAGLEPDLAVVQDAAQGRVDRGHQPAVQAA
jgi:hypothetical protein